MTTHTTFDEPGREQDESMSKECKVNGFDDRKNSFSQETAQVDVLKFFKLMSAILVVLIGIAGYWIAGLRW